MPGIDGTGGGGLQPPVDLTFQQPVSGDLVQLGKLGQSMLNTKDELSSLEKTTLENAARALLDSPELPAPDRQALSNWLQTLSTVQVSTQAVDTAECDPTLLAHLTSENPDDVDSAINVLFGSKLTPEQKAVLRDGLVAKNKQDTGSPALKSWSPDVIKQELVNILKQAAETHPEQSDLEITPDQDQAFYDAAKTLSTTNIICGDAPELNPLLKTLTESDNEAEVLDALKGQVDLSSLSEADASAVIGQLGELAKEIAAANGKGQPLGALKSTDPDQVAAGLKELIADKGAGLSETAKTALAGAISDIGASVAAKNGEQLSLNTTHSVIIGVVRPSANPYATPGIMALLAPVLSELSKIYAQIIMQNSLLKQNMMNLMLTMAKEAFGFAIAAGEAKVKQLEIEMNQYITSAVTAGVMLGVSMAVAGLQMGMAAGSREAYHSPKSMDKFSREDVIPGSPTLAGPNSTQENPTIIQKFKPTDPNSTEGSFYAEVSHDPKSGELSYRRLTVDPAPVKDPITKRTPPLSEKNFRPSNDADYYGSSDYHSFNQKWQAAQGVISSSMQGVNSMLDNAGKAYWTSQKMEPVMEEAKMNAMKEFIGQLIGTINDTISSLEQGKRDASDAWQKFNELFRDMGSTIARSIYGA